MENKCSKINEFCYVCGQIVPKNNGQNRKTLFTEEFKSAYHHYFDEPDTSSEYLTQHGMQKLLQHPFDLD